MSSVPPQLLSMHPAMAVADPWCRVHPGAPAGRAEPLTVLCKGQGHSSADEGPRSCTSPDAAPVPCPPQLPPGQACSLPSPPGPPLVDQLPSREADPGGPQAPATAPAQHWLLCPQRSSWPRPSHPGMPWRDKHTRSPPGPAPHHLAIAMMPRTRAHSQGQSLAGPLWCPSSCSLPPTSALCRGRKVTAPRSTVLPSAGFLGSIRLR